MKVCPQTKETIDNDVLRSIVENKKKYFLLLSADRVTKNGENMLKAFKRYVEHSSKPSLLVTTGCKKSLFPQHVALPFLSSSDIDNAYKHAHALLYPSMFEGFGYPPIEAMRYGETGTVVKCLFYAGNPGWCAHLFLTIVSVQYVWGIKNIWEFIIRGVTEKSYRKI